MTTTHPVNMDDVARYIAATFNGDDWIELRAIRIQGRGGHVQFVQANKVETISDWIDAHNSPNWSCFIGANPRKSDSGSGANGAAIDDDVSVFHSIFVDFDDATIDEALQRITDAGLQPATMMIASGRATGTHAYWRLREPLTDAALWKRLQVGLIRALNSDKSIKNPSRIMRLPGTENHKRNAPCRIISCKGPDDWFLSWEDIGVVPADGEEQFEFVAPDPNLRPDDRNLNNTTLRFLSEETPEGERNNRLIAAALDFNANNFEIDDALNRLVSLAVERDGLDQGEAERTVRSGYARPASPSFKRIIGPEVSMADLAATLNEDRGMASTETDTSLDGAAQPIHGDELRPAVPTDDSGDPDLPTPSVRRDGLPTDPRDRPHVANVSSRVVMDNGRRRVITVYKPIDQIGRDMSDALGGWPRRSKSTGPFALKQSSEGPEIWTIYDANDMFALIHDRATVRWTRGDCESELGDTLSAVTKTEFFKWVKDNIEPCYDSVAELPHVPPRQGLYYLPIELPDPTGSCLQEFISRLNPATDIDRQLMIAAMMTPGWGGPPGARPVFVFSSDYGQGSGKTETAKAIGRIWGGASTLDYEDNWQNISKRIMSSDDWLSRVFLFDNVKGKFGGAAIEAAVTSENLTGHKMFVGTVKRPNDATFIVTFNLPEMSRDLAERAVVIKLGPPKAGDFVEWSQDFIRENKLQLIADLLDLLKAPVQGTIDRTNRDRWAAWQRDVLARVPNSNPDELAASIIERRPTADAEAEEASEIVQAISNYIIGEGRKTDQITEITTAEIVRVMEESGNWTPNDSYSQSANARKCISVVRGKLLGRGVLMPLETSGQNGNRPKRVRVDDTGRPTRHRSGKQSVVYGWVWDKASEICDDEFQGGGQVDLPI